MVARRFRRTGVSFVVVGLVGGSLVAVGNAAEPPPAEVGLWSTPFEEGGAEVPRCQPVDGEGSELACKPTAVTSVVLPDGRVLYWNGIEGSENNQYGIAAEGGRTGRDSRARVLDLGGGSPRFAIPRPDNGGGSNPNIDDETDPFGAVGVPGRPGDGLVGSTVGEVAPQNPTDPPDDSWANDADLFCTDQAHLADGRLLIVGGSDWYSEPGIPEDVPEVGGMGVVELEGLRNARVFDPRSNTFVDVQPMKYGRWYPTTVVLPDGKVFVAGGVTKLIKSSQGSQVRRTETFDPATGTWTENYTGMASENSLPLFARLHLMPNGKIFYGGVGQTFGPAGQAVDEALWGLQQFFDPATNEWEMVGPASLGTRGGAFSVLLPMKAPYDRATLLVGGGTLGSTPGSYLATGLTELVTVDKDGNVTSEQAGDLSNPRWFSSAVPLPDGTVAVFSGADKDEVLSPGMELPVRQAELFDPETGEWSALAAGTRDRTYHNSAVLLPDMRILVGGHAPITTLYGTNRDAVPGVTANNDKDPSFEVFSPPYLFRGPRPRIAGVQSGLAWGRSFGVRLDNVRSDEIESVVLMRLPALTHIVDPNQRTLELAFQRDGNRGLVVQAPPDGIAAPPGPYYLVVNRRTSKGSVPSVARIVTVGSRADARPAAAPVADTTRAASRGSATEPEDTSVLANP